MLDDEMRLGDVHTLKQLLIEDVLVTIYISRGTAQTRDFAFRLCFPPVMNQKMASHMPR